MIIFPNGISFFITYSKLILVMANTIDESVIEMSLQIDEIKVTRAILLLYIQCDIVK